MPVGVASTSAIMAAAVTAGLIETGWRAARTIGLSHLAAPQMALVVVADEDDHMPDVSWFSQCYATPVTILVACGAPAGQPAVYDSHGVVIVDAGQPLQSQLRAISRVLAVVDRAHPSHRSCWDADSARVAALTHRELQILDALMTGAVAAEIAAALVLSLPTVRTHIRSILTKLGVTSQLAAVAMACRIRCRPDSRRCELHQY